MHRYIRSLISVVVLLLAGCQPADPPAPVDANDAAYRDSRPRDYLAAVFSRYRHAAAYSDRGEVRLIYREGGETRQHIAPASVWLDHEQLYIEAYDVRLWSDATWLTGWIVDPATDHFDSQVMRRRAQPGRPKMGTLFDDPVLVDRIAAGLAGPPPQLEWLFAGEPMKELFTAEYDFRFGEKQQIDQRECQSVRVTADDQPYVFWVDRQQSLVRRIELPPVVAPPSPGAQVQTMPLILELSDATFSSGISPKPSPLPPNPRYVARFVPLPPPRPAAILGTKLQPFSLTVGDRSFQVGTRQPRGGVTLLMRFDGDPASLATVAALQSWGAQMPAELRERIRIVVLLQPDGNPLPDWCSLPAVVDRQRIAGERLQLEPAQSVLVAADGRIQWKQEPIVAERDPSQRDQQLVYLGAVVGDLLQGVDIPKRLADQWQQQVVDYRQALQRQTIRSN